MCFFVVYDVFIVLFNVPLLQLEKKVQLLLLLFQLYILLYENVDNSSTALFIFRKQLLVCLISLCLSIYYGAHTD